ncbi:unnamed protein product [Nesidiocoris tenuis]|uniref:Uncharacterized protein n=2 Tax=Nesidiocoris tenuis TaxID=355587 RepID=A0ABN7AI97_9HEMI|nr:Hypothetical protein NTJ_04800 [Nesidiocoris tenuis]CAB0015727.1 unnamed protein product [Nesidiocoris tenuis]
MAESNKEGSIRSQVQERTSNKKQTFRSTARKIQKNSETSLSSSSGCTNSKLPLMTGKPTLAYHQHIVSQTSTSSDSPSGVGLNSPTTSASSSVSSPVRLVKTKKTKTIPKVTLSNQLLKSNAVNTEPDKKPGAKKTTAKTTLKEPSFWTPEKLSLLNQITPDVTLRTELITAANTYWKSRNKLKTKPIVAATAVVKPPVKQKVTTANLTKNELSTDNPGRLSATKQIAKPKGKKVRKTTSKSRRVPPKPKTKVSFKPGSQKSSAKRTGLNSVRKVPMGHQSSFPKSGMEENQRKNASETKATVDQLTMSSGLVKNQGSRNVHERHQAGFDGLKNFAKIQ